jgi:hypothetical protein
VLRKDTVDTNTPVIEGAGHKPSNFINGIFLEYYFAIQYHMPPPGQRRQGPNVVAR